jgi:hypothetical protein
MRGHTGGALTMGRRCPLVTSTKHKLKAQSSMVSDLVAVDDMITQILWAHLFMKAQGVKICDNILYQDTIFWQDQKDNRTVHLRMKSLPA